MILQNRQRPGTFPSTLSDWIMLGIISLLLVIMLLIRSSYPQIADTQFIEPETEEFGHDTTYPPGAEDFFHEQAATIQ